jgi:hypothetical protein
MTHVTKALLDLMNNENELNEKSLRIKYLREMFKKEPFPGIENFNYITVDMYDLNHYSIIEDVKNNKLFRFTISDYILSEWFFSNIHAALNLAILGYRDGTSSYLEKEEYLDEIDSYFFVNGSPKGFSDFLSYSLNYLLLNEVDVKVVASNINKTAKRLETLKKVLKDVQDPRLSVIFEILEIFSSPEPEFELPNKKFNEFLDLMEEKKETCMKNKTNSETDKLFAEIDKMFIDEIDKPKSTPNESRLSKRILELEAKNSTLSQELIALRWRLNPEIMHN